MTLPSCPDSELLAACAEARLAGEERERVLRHVTFCADCYTVYAETLRFLDEPSAAAAAGAPSPQPTPVPPTAEALEAATPSDAAHRPGRVVPIDRGRRLRRAATVLLPIAAAAALAVLVASPLRHGPAAPRVPVAAGQPPASGAAPSQAPEPSGPSPAASPYAPSGLPIHAARLQGDRAWGWTSGPRAPAFGGASAQKVCRLVGVCEVDLQVARELGLEQTRERLRWTAAFLSEAGAPDRLVRHFERLQDDAGAGRVPAVEELRADPSPCEPDSVRAGRALEWLRLAARTRDPAALQHPGVVEGLAAARRAASPSERRRLDALLDDLARLGPGEREWRSQEEAVSRLIREWLP